MGHDDRGYTSCPLTLFHLFALGVLSWFVVLLFVDIRLAAVPPAVFFLVVLTAPFFPKLRFFLPVVVRGDRKNPWVAMTFDDGPDPATTPSLLKLLSQYAVKAAFFPVGQKAERHPDLVRDILAAGHEIGNHTYRHDVFLMLRRSKVLAADVAAGQNVLRSFGIRPLAFRPPVGITNPHLYPVLLRTGSYCVGFRRHPADFGNRRLRGLSRRVLRSVKAGDILLLHDSPPPGRFAVERWLKEVEEVILGLGAKGLRTASLSDVLRRPVMESVSAETPSAPDAVRAFYDHLAEDYDAEQDRPRSSRLRQAEEARFAGRIGLLMRDSPAVMEIGAGTGRFTVALAKMSGHVLAVDLSPRMLDVLGRKLRSHRLSNVTTFCGNVNELTGDDRFGVICSFSSFEYVRDIERLFRRLRPLLTADGTLYFITARRSAARFFLQIGNALRQGVWLHARSGRGIVRMLQRSGFRTESVSAFGLKSLWCRGLLLEVVARTCGSTRDRRRMETRSSASSRPEVDERRC
jgi:peptidoglycan/xylan/chitin deacetylase (PgdA/CDA1 family)/SAM-dependent methyltransferase